MILYTVDFVTRGLDSHLGAIHSDGRINGLFDRWLRCATASA